VYAGEIEKTADGLAPGDAVEVVDHRGRFLAGGYYNPASRIAVRVLTRRKDEPVDAALLRRRIAQAVAYRVISTPPANRAVWSSARGTCSRG